MKVILLKDVKKVGNKDDVIEVSQGFAQNVLFKQKVAVEATKSNIKNLEEKINDEKLNYEEEVKTMKIIKNKLENKEFIFHLKNGKNGNVFGSISSKQIIEKLKDEGYQIDKKQVKMNPISHLGYDTVKIFLNKDVEAEIKVLVKGE